MLYRGFNLAILGCLVAMAFPVRGLAMTPRHTLSCLDLMAVANEAGAYSGGNTRNTPPSLPAPYQRFSELLERGVFNASDLAELDAFFDLLEPDDGGALARAAKAISHAFNTKNGGNQMGVTHQTYSQAVERAGAGAAEKIVLNVFDLPDGEVIGASPLVVKHERVHAVGYKDLPEDYRIPIPAIPRQGSVFEIYQAILKNRFFDEAMAFSGEIHLERNFRKKTGHSLFDFKAQEPYRGGYDAMEAAYRVKGHQGLYEHIAQLDGYQAYRIASLYLAILIKGGMTDFPSWHKIMEGAGIRESGGNSLLIDSSQVMKFYETHIQPLVASSKLQMLVAFFGASAHEKELLGRAAKYFTGQMDQRDGIDFLRNDFDDLVKYVDQKIAERAATQEKPGVRDRSNGAPVAAKHSEPAEAPGADGKGIPAQAFKAEHASPKSGAGADQPQPTHDERRVRIAGKFPEFLREAIEIEVPELGTDKYFDDLLSIAEHTDGRQSNETYKELYQLAQKPNPDPHNSSQEAKRVERLRRLGMSLLRSQRTTLGQKTLNEMLDHYNDGHHLQIEALGALIGELAPLGQSALLGKIQGFITERVESLKTSIIKSLISSYGDFGTFTNEGKEKIARFTRQRSGKLTTAKQVFDLMRALIASGDYTSRRDDRHVKNPLFHFQESYMKRVSELGKTAASLSKAAGEILAKDQTTSRQLDALALLLYDLSFAGAFGAFHARLLEWEEEGVYYDPKTGLEDFIQRLTSSSKVTRESDLEQSLPEELMVNAYAVFRDERFFEKGLPILYSLEPNLNVLALYGFAAARFPMGTDSSRMIHFVGQWKRVQGVLAEKMPQRQFIEHMGSLARVDAYRKYDTGLRPADPSEAYAISNSRLQMALFLIKNSDAGLREQGEKIIDGLPVRQKDFFNPHDLPSGLPRYFGAKALEYNRSTNASNSAEFKIFALLEGFEASPHRHDWVVQAYELAKRVPFDVAKLTLSESEHRLYHRLQLMEDLARTGRLDEARSMYDQLTQWAVQLEQHHKTLLNDYEKLPPHEKTEVRDSYGLKSNSEKAEFWLQHIHSDTRARLAVALSQQGRSQRATALAQETIEAIAHDVRSRRQRFDVRSIISSAKELSRQSHLQADGIRLYDIAIQKLALLRDNQADFSKTISFLSESVKNSGLDDPRKDEILRKLITALEPEKSKGWKEMANSISALVKTAKDVASDGKYPKAELESLRVIDELLVHLNFNREGWYNSAQLALLKELYEDIVKHHPTLTHSSSYPRQSGASNDPVYQRRLVALHPDEALETQRAKEMGAGEFNLDLINAGRDDREQTHVRLKTELAKALFKKGKAGIGKLRRLLEIYAEVIRQDLKKKRIGMAPEARLSLVDVLRVRGIQELRSFLNTRAWTKDHRLTEGEIEIVKTLLKAESGDEANAKYELYQTLLSNERVPTSVQKIAFENFLMTGTGGSYLSGYFDRNIAHAPEPVQRRFYGWMSTLIALRKLPSEKVLYAGNIFDYEDLLAFFLEGSPAQSEAFLLRLKNSFNRPRLPAEKFGRSSDDVSHYRGPEAGFSLLRGLALKMEPQAWTPDLFDENDIMLYYTNRLEGMGWPEDLFEHLRALYVRDGMDFLVEGDKKYSYTASDLGHELGKIRPGFRLGDKELEVIQSLFNGNGWPQHGQPAPQMRGEVTYSDLQRALLRGIEPTERQLKHLGRFLKGVDSQHARWLVHEFGPRNLTVEQKARLARVLDDVERHCVRRREKISEAKVEMPRSFEQSPEFVRFLLKGYFRHLSFGERQSILSEFQSGAHDLSPPQALRRFFEITGTEKIGQFLSTRRDLVPEEYRREFEKFQERVQPGSFDEVRSTIEIDFGKPVGQIFKWINPKPISVGTIGEVYEAVLLSGERVAVKVITKSRRQQINRMLAIMKAVSEELAEHQDQFKGAYDPLEVYGEFKSSMIEEVDFRRELKNAQEMRLHLIDGITIPRYHEELTSESVLVQAFAEGVNIKNINDPVLRKAVAAKLGALLLKHLLEIGAYHDDLHPGNFRVDPQTGEIELLDFGRIGHLTEQERSNLIPLIAAVKLQSSEKVIEILEALRSNPAESTAPELGETIKGVMEHASGRGTTTLLSELFFEARRHGAPVNSSFLRVLKAVMIFEGTAQELDPAFNFEEFVQTYVLNKATNGNWDAITDMFGRIFR